MAIVFIDGFDTYKSGISDAYFNGISLADKWNCNDSNTLSVGYMTVGQNGASLPGTPAGQYLISNGTNTSSNRIFANVSPLTSICVGFHYSPTVAIGSGTNIVTIYNQSAITAANVVQIVTNSTGYLQVLAGGNTYVSTGKPLVLDKWMFIEVQLTFTGRAVTGSIYADGFLILSFTEAAALSTTASFQNINAVSIGKGLSWTSAAVVQRYDNFYITDGERLGEVFIPAFTPSSGPASPLWLANGDGTNSAMLSDIGSNDSMASNVVSNTVGDKDIYRLNIPTNLASYASAVKGVSTFMQASGSTIGTTGVNTVMRNTATDTTVATVNLEASRKSKMARSSVLSTKPSNNTAWTVTDLQNLRVGIESKNYQSGSPQYLLSSGANGVITNNSRAAQVSTQFPTTSGDYLVFNGSSSLLLYNRLSVDSQPVWQFTPPFSLEWDMTVPAIPGTGGANRTIISFGRNDNNTPYGEIAISYDIRGIGCYFQGPGGAISPATGPFLYQWFANGTNNAIATTPTDPTPNQNYKFGLMLFSDLTTVYLRGYLDGVQRFQAPVVVNYDSRSAGLSIGGSTDYGSTSRFNGQIANMRMDNSLFWPLYNDTANARSRSFFKMSSTGAITMNAGSAATTLPSGFTTPATSANGAIFTGSSALRYTDSICWHVTGSFSFECEFNVNATGTDQRIFVLSGGQSNSELSFRVTGTTLQLGVTNNNNASVYIKDITTTIAAGTWYKVGFMFYTDSSGIRLRTFLNDVQVSDEPTIEPYDSTNGPVFGTLVSGGSSFTGLMRNMFISNDRFWDV